MESFIREFIVTSLDLDDGNRNVFLPTVGPEDDDMMLLNRRLSPYATLRPGDLAALMRLHSPLASRYASKSKHHSRSIHVHNLNTSVKITSASSTNSIINSCDDLEELRRQRDRTSALPQTIQEDAESLSNVSVSDSDASSSSYNSDEECQPADFIDVVCRGADCGHVPTEYLVKGIRQHEMPVIGEYRVVSFFYIMLKIIL